EDHILQESSEETNDPEAHPEPSGDDSQLETHRQTAKAKVVEEDLISIASRKAKKLVAASLIGATLLLSLILGLWSVLRSGRNLNGSFDIQTVTEGAQVFFIVELVGETCMHIESLATGKYELHIENTL